MPLSLSKQCQQIAPSVTLAIDAKAKAMKAEGVDIVGFGAGEPDFPTPEYICDAAREALAKGMTRYTPANGTPALKKAVCDKLLADNGLSYAPDQVIICNGAKQALLNAFLALINPGDEVLIPSPCWVSYPEMVRMAGGTPVFVPVGEESGFLAEAAVLAAYVTPNTKALVLNSPCNPTGAVYSRAQLAAIADLAVEAGFYIVADEIYEKLIYEDAEHISIASLGEAVKAQTIVINGLSKSYAMTGWRIGYAAGPAPIVKLMTNYQSHATSNPNTMAQHAGVTALSKDDGSIEVMRQAFDQRRSHMVARISGIEGLSCPTPKGAFYLMMNITQILGMQYRGQKLDSAMTFARLLLEHAHVAVVPGEAFEAPAYCRLSYAISLEDIDKGIDRIAAFVAELKE